MKAQSNSSLKGNNSSTNKPTKPTLNGMEASCLPVSNVFLLSPFQEVTTILNLMCISPVLKEQSLQLEVNEIHNEGILKKYDLTLKAPSHWPPRNKIIPKSQCLQRRPRDLCRQSSSYRGRKIIVTSNHPFERWFKPIVIV